MESKHTPGPWKIAWPDWDDEWEFYHDPDAGDYEGSASIDGEGWSQLAKVTVMVNGEEDEAGKANARLIAASPTMYEYIARKAQEGDTDAQAIISGI